MKKIKPGKIKEQLFLKMKNKVEIKRLKLSIMDEIYEEFSNFLTEKGTNESTISNVTSIKVVDEATPKKPLPQTKRVHKKEGFLNDKHEKSTDFFKRIESWIKEQNRFFTVADLASALEDEYGKIFGFERKEFTRRVNHCLSSSILVAFVIKQSRYFFYGLPKWRTEDLTPLILPAHYPSPKYMAAIKTKGINMDKDIIWKDLELPGL